MLEATVIQCSLSLTGKVGQERSKHLVKFKGQVSQTEGLGNLVPLLLLLLIQHIILWCVGYFDVGVILLLKFNVLFIPKRLC